MNISASVSWSGGEAEGPVTIPTKGPVTFMSVGFFLILILRIKDCQTTPEKELKGHQSAFGEYSMLWELSIVTDDFTAQGND
jgi:hypothetical protein